MANNPQFSGFQPPRPPVVGSVDPPRSFVQPVPVQPWPAVPGQQPQQFVALPSVQFQPAGHVAPPVNAGMPSIPQQSQFTPSVQHLPPRPGHVVQNGLPSAALPMPISQPNKPIVSESVLHQPIPPALSNFVPAAVIGPGTLLSSSYTFASQGVQHQMNFMAPRPPIHYPQMSQSNTSSVSSEEQPRLSSESQSFPVSSVQQTSEQSLVSSAAQGTNIQPKPNGGAQTDWIEHTSGGRRYYYNKRTKQSSWQKPFELMTEIERADATTDWKEYMSPDGRVYYYNKVTKQSKWRIPEELKLAREQVSKKSVSGAPSETPVNNQPVALTSVPAPKAPNQAEASSSTVEGAMSSPVPVVSDNVAADTEPAPISVSAVEKPVDNPNLVGASEAADVAAPTVDEAPMPMADNSPKVTAAEIAGSPDGVTAPDKEAIEDETVAQKGDKSSEEKSVNPEPLQYPTKQEAKNAFKALLEAANIGSDWTWERAMRVIIMDKRYGALKTLGERKEAFNEFIGQRKKQEVEDRRNKQKKTREDFLKMLEEAEELTSSSRWSKVVTLFEDDERFKAIERERDRKDLFEDFIHELEKKERAKAVEDRKRNIMEYRQFLQSCDFITANSQWRKVQDRLEADERCSRLEKIDRLEVFQEYLRDLDKEEEEQRKMLKEELRKVERKKRDEFRKLMEEHVAAGVLTAKTHWRDYFVKVENLSAYTAVASNTSGSTPKELFEDVLEELIKQYEEDKTLIEDVVKLRKIMLSSTSTLEDLKRAIADDLSGSPISDINLKLVFDEMLDRVRKKEEKEAKRQKRLGDKFFELLQSIREITPSSTWENCKHLFESSHECSSIKDENFRKEIFEEYITALKEQEKEYERRRKEEKAEREKERLRKEKRRAKEKREKEKYEKEEEESRDDGANSDISSEKKKSSNKDRDKRHHRHHQETADDANETEKDRSRRSHRHSGDHKKYKQRSSSPESDGESRHKRHKREHRNGSRRSSGYEELEDGEFGS